MRAFAILLTVLTLSLQACNPITERMPHYAVHGIDISHHQARINWDTVAVQNLHFSFIKATEGATFKDSLYCHNWNELARIQLKKGAYHFFRPKVDPLLQAQNFIDEVVLQDGDLPPVLDIEVIDGCTDMEILEGVQKWLNIIEEHYQIQPIIYTNLNFYRRFIAGHFDAYPIWIARYNHFKPQLAYGNSWIFWQYGNKGRVNGIKGDVDLNVFYGSLDELDALSYQPPILLSVIQ